jgi:hypothetical protein
MIFHVTRAKDNFRKCNIEKIISPDGKFLTTKEDMLAGTEFLEGVRDCYKLLPSLAAPISSLKINSALLAIKKNKSSGYF